MEVVKRLARVLLGLGSLLPSFAMAMVVNVDDVAFRIPTDPFQSADAAAQRSGNDNPGGVNALGGLFAGDAWSLLDKTDGASSEFLGVDFVLEADVGSGSGNWSLAWNGAGLPLSMDFVFVTKAARNWGAYLFQAVDFTADPSSGDGTFVIPWVNGGGNIPGLSHASIYGRVAADTPPDEPDPPGVPLPGTLLLFSLGVGLLRFAKAKPG